jgi:hypothetical protein
MEVSFSLGAITIIIGIIVSISRVFYVKGFNKGIDSKSNAKQVRHLNVTGSVMHLSATILIFLGFVFIRYFTPEPKVTTQINVHQAAGLLALEGELFKIKVLQKVETKLVEQEQGNPIDVINFKEEIVGLAKNERFKLTRLNLKLTDSEYLTNTIDKIYPIEKLRGEFDRMRPIIENETLSIDQKIKRLDNEITTVQDNIKTAILQKSTPALN